MRASHRCFALVFISILLSNLLLPSLSRAEGPQLAPAQEATHYLAVDAHPADRVAIAVDPYDTHAKIATVFHIDYPAYNILPVRLIVTNNSERPISLADARIDFITASGDKVPAAEPIDVERKMSAPKRSDNGYKIGPFTIGKHKPKDKQIEEDFSNYEYSSVAVEPHSTRAGFLFYDIEDLQQLKPGARLEVRKVRDSTGKELFAFEIPFDKYLAAKPK